MTDALRRAIREFDVPYLTLEQETGVCRASITRFMRREQSLRLDLADRLAKYFGITVRLPGKKGRER